LAAGTSVGSGESTTANWVRARMRDMDGGAGTDL
jgi:hypothetical protein